MAENKCYVYSFWNKNNEIIYIGKTYRDLYTRLKEHRHLKGIYSQTARIKFFEVDSYTMCDLTELALINYYCPIGNNKDLHQGEKKVLPLELISFFQKEWNDLDENIFTLLNFQQKEEKQLLTPEERKKAQMAGIEKARAEGKYTGRKQREIDWEAFGLLYDDNKAGLITKVDMETAIGCSRPTLLKYIKQYEEMK